MTLTGFDPEAGNRLAASVREAGVLAERAANRLAQASWPSAPSAGVMAALSQLGDAEQRLRQGASELDAFERSTVLAGYRYRMAEWAGRTAAEAVAGALGYTVGAVTRTYAVELLGAAAVVAAMALPALVLAQHPAFAPLRSQIAAHPLARAVGDFLADRGREIASDPAFIAAVELAIESADEVLAGILGVPVARVAVRSATVDDATLQRDSIALLAGIASRVAGRSVLGSTPTAVQVEGETRAAPPATTLAEGFRALPSGDDDIVIQQYELADGSAHWQVFMRGTRDFSLEGDGTAMDLGSNLQNATVTGADLSGSAAALSDAMVAAGIQPGDSVDLVGHSQGGSAAALVAASGRFSVQNVVTFGGATGNIVVPRDVTHLAVENRQDIVPALGGTHGDGSSVIVQVDVPASAIGDEQSGQPAPFHLSDAYSYSATTLDASGDPTVDAIVAGMAAPTVGATAVGATTWRVQRV